MRREPTNIRFSDLSPSLRGIFWETTAIWYQPYYFQNTLTRRSSREYPERQGKAKAYQVRQALLAIDKLKEHQNER